MQELTKRRRWMLCFIYFFLYLFGYQFIASSFIVQAIGLQSFLNLDMFVSIAMILIVLGISFPYLKEQWKQFRRNKKIVSPVLMTVFSLYVAAILCTLFIVIPFQLSTSENQMNNELLFQYQPFNFVISALLLAPIVEEVIFRGCIFQPISKKSMWLGAFVSGFVFGLLHVVASLESASWMNLLYIVQYGLSGFILSIAYGSTNTIFTSIFAHALFNFMSLLSLL